MIRHRQQRERFDRWKSENGSEIGGVLTGEAWALVPEMVRWRVSHYSCGTGHSERWWIATARFRTTAALMHTAAHLLTKSWIGDTDLGNVLAEASGAPDASGRRRVHRAGELTWAP